MIRIELPAFLNDEDFTDVARTCDRYGLAAELTERDHHQGVDPDTVHDVIMWILGGLATVLLEDALKAVAEIVRIVSKRLNGRTSTSQDVLLRIRPSSSKTFNFTADTLSALPTLAQLGVIDQLPDGDYFWSEENGWEMR